MQRRTFLQAGGAALARAADIPAKFVVLTLDDAVKSHRSFVAPLLKDLGFGATFFVTHLWMDDREYFMNWRDMGEIHEWVLRSATTRGRMPISRFPEMPQGWPANSRSLRTN